MDLGSCISLNVANEADRKGMMQLLSLVKLPILDLPGSLGNFYLIREGRNVIGCVGLEVYGSYALLRSLATHPDHRSNGVGQQLYNKIIDVAKEKKVEEIYLITNTAEGYFKARGYEAIPRDSVPIEIQKTAQFKGVCPSSAAVMKKHL